MKDMPFMAEISEEHKLGDAESECVNAQSLEIAQRVLNEQEFECIMLAFGFDGAGSRSLPQLAKDLDLVRPEAEALLNGAIQKMQAAVQ